MEKRLKRKQLAVFVEDSPGVLTHVSGLISRRGYNIESIAASKTEKDNVTRISLVVQITEDWQLEQIMAQLEKLVQVYGCLKSQHYMQREGGSLKPMTSLPEVSQVQ